MGRDPWNTAGIQTHVERQGNMFRPEVIEPVSDLLYVSDGRAADHRARDPQVQHPGDGGGIAQAAAHLQIDASPAGQLRDDALVAETAVLGAVEIDDVQPIGAVAAVLFEQGPRVSLVARLGGEVAVQQPHTVSGLQIDGGDEAHARSLSDSWAWPAACSMDRQKIPEQPRAA